MFEYDIFVISKFQTYMKYILIMLTHLSNL